MTDTPTGEKIPVSARNRWVRALWNIATENEKSSTVIRWWATWPVEPIDGFMVSDYVGWHSFGVTGQAVDAPGKVWPADLQSALLAKLPSPDEVDPALLRTMVHVPEEKLFFDASRGPFGGPLPHLRQAIATARGYTDIALDLLERRRTDFFAVYYEGTDAAMHLFTIYAPPKLEWVSKEDFAAFRDAIRGYWQYQDRLLGELLAQRQANTTVIIVSDHGFRTGDERLREEEFAIEFADASHMIDGVLVINGPHVQRGVRIRGADLYDVAPTVLHLMGLPVAEDMAGEVIESAFTAEFWASHPVRTVPTFETGEWDRGDDIVIDPAAGENMEEMLRSLGYISGSSEEPASDSGSEAEGTASMTIEHTVNLANVLKRQGRLDEAARLLEQKLEEQPLHFEARQNLAAILGALGEYDRALALFSELRREDPENLAVIEDHALGLAKAGRLEDAIAAYDAGLVIDPEWAIGRAGRGLALHQAGRSDDGLRDLNRAIELDPRSAIAHFYLGVFRTERGEQSAALRSFERVLQLEPTHEQAALELARLLQSRGQNDDARVLLEELVELSGSASGVTAALAVLHLNTGEPEKAIAVLQEGLRLRPDDIELLGNLSVAYTATGGTEEARRALERVVELEPGVPEARVRLADLFFQAGEMEKSEAQLVDAARLAPEDSEIQMALATFYHRTGRLPQAMRVYETILAREPDHALALYQLALANGASGNEAKAMEMLQRARTLDPSLPMPQRRGQ
jgi:tetratricopeptide (TPR) repeat protein